MRYSRRMGKHTHNTRCQVIGCSRPYYCKGYCLGHYFQARRGSRLHPVGEAGGARPWLDTAKVTLALRTEDMAILKRLAAEHGLGLSEVAARVVEAALAAGVEIEL